MISRNHASLFELEPYLIINAQPQALIGLFHKIILNHSKNKMDANNLATIFAPSLIR